MEVDWVLIRTGTRSWTFKASGGNLNITSGDGNGTLTGQIDASQLDSIDSSQFLRLILLTLLLVTSVSLVVQMQF